jgi:Acetyltransferase (GNAT) domain
MPFEEGRVTWTAMVGECANAALYHQPAWVDLLSAAYGFSPFLTILEEQGRVVAACVLARTKSPFGRRIVSLPFSDFCPPLALNDEAATRLMKALTHHMSGAVLEIRGIKYAPEWASHEHFALVTLCLNRGLKEIERGLSVNFRRNLRRAMRENITVSHSNTKDELRRFYRLQILTRRKFGLPAQPWRFFNLAHKMLASPCALDVWIARRGGREVSSAVLLRAGEKVYYKWGARLPGDDSRANHLLLWNAIEEYRSLANSFDLGRTDTRNHGLLRFKMELGGTIAPLAYSYYPYAPSDVSPEALSGVRKSVSVIWSNLPIMVTRVLGRAFYRYLA